MRNFSLSIAPPDAPGSSAIRGYSGFQYALILAGIVFLTLWSFRPTDTVLSASLDVSNYGSYSHFTATGYHFGREVVAMAGPYGFIPYGFVYTGELYWTRLALELLVKGSFSVLVFWFFLRSRSRAWRWVWLAAIFATAPLIEDTPYDLAVLLAGLYLILHFEDRKSLWPAFLASALLALLSLCKGTQLAYVAPTLVLVAVAAIFTRRVRRGLAIAAAFTISYLAFWALAGQDFRDIPGFLRGVNSLASGYNEAMGLDEVPRATHLGLGLLGLLVLSALVGAWLNRRQRPALLACLLLAGFAFTQWKHGFVRADGHIFIFYLFGVAAAAIPVVLTSSRETLAAPVIRWILRGLTSASLVLALIASDHGHSAGNWLGALRSHLPPKLHAAFHPAAHQVELQAGLSVAESKFALPTLREKIGRHTVDFFGSDHGFIPLNQLNYHPRPVGGGSFNVYSEYLKKLNETFLLDPVRRPDFYLVKPQILDGRLLSGDDSRMYRPLLYNYEPVETERSVVLFQRREAPTPPAPSPLSTQSFRWAETVVCPVPAADEIVLASFEIDLNWLGRLRAFFYKPPPVYLSLSPSAAGIPIEHRESVRLIPALARSPVIFSPVIENIHDILGLYTTEAGKRLQDFRVHTSFPNFFQSNHLKVTFYRLPRPPAAKQAEAVSARTRFPCSNLGAESATPPAFPHYLDDRYVVGFHAPSRAVFPLTGAERALNLEFGMEPATYTNNGATNGVTFIVELKQPSLGEQTLYRRHLDPLKNPAERGPQRDRVVLPPAIQAGSKLTVRTDPGPYGDNAWDWSYFTRVDAEKGPYVADQFPGFASLPEKVDGDYASAMNTGERMVFMLNAPGRLTFPLHGTEARVTFGGGYMPGAYTGDGHTDGAEYIVELVTPAGTVKPVYRRTLNPRDVANDRGFQNFSIDLPPHADGSKLVVRTDPGTAGDGSWDWTYVSDVAIR